MILYLDNKEIRIKFSIFLLMLIVVGIPGQASADAGQWLAGVSTGTSTLEPDTTGSPFQVDQTGSSGYKLYLGYDINSKITVEGFWTDLGEVTFSNGGALSYNFYGLGAHYYFPENSEGSAVFAKVGLGQINVSGDVPFNVENSTQIYFGGGLEVQFTNGLSLRGEYEYYDSDAQFFSLSLNKRFGVVKAKLPQWAKDQGMKLDEPGRGPSISIAETGGMTELTAEDFKSPEIDQKQPLDTPASNELVPAKEAPVEAKKVWNLTGILGVIEGVSFISGTPILNDDSSPVLDQLAEAIKQFEDVNFAIIGHTDDVGDSATNKALSLQRAIAVGAYLESKGVNSATMHFIGAGEEEPITRNETPEGRATNRRIELLLN